MPTLAEIEQKSTEIGGVRIGIAASSLDGEFGLTDGYGVVVLDLPEDAWDLDINEFGDRYLAPAVHGLAEALAPRLSFPVAIPENLLRDATARFARCLQAANELRAIGVLENRAPEVTVTPEMIAAGEAAMGEFPRGQLVRTSPQAIYRAMRPLEPAQSTTVVTDDVLAQRNAAWDRIAVLERERDAALEELSAARTFGYFRNDLCERQARALGDAANVIAAKDARIAELDTVLAQRPAIQMIQPVRPSPFREFPSDPRRLGG